MKTRRITFSAMCLALSLLLPQAFHLVGMQGGATFLPMHIPVLIGGLVLGPVYGLCVGIVAPLLSSMLTGMPAPSRVWFMVAELATYGLVSGLLFHNLKLYKNKLGVWISLILSMIAGRIVYGLALVFTTNLLGVPVGGFGVMLASVSTGIPGIIIQLVIVPAIVIAVNRTTFFNQLKQGISKI